MGAKRANGEGTIYQLPNGRWRVLVSYVNAEGKTRRTSRKVKSRADARAVLDELRGDMSSGVKMDNGNKTVKTYLDEWLNVAVAPNLAENTLKSYKNAVEKHLNPRLGLIALKKLCASQIAMALASMETDGTGARTRQNAFVVLKAALTQAVQWQELARNPADRVTKPTAEREEIRPFTLTEAKRFLQEATGSKHEALYHLAITTGMRQGELFGLHWDAIDFQARKLIVRQQATEVWNNLRIKAPKTKASIRTIDLTDTVIAKLQAHREQLQKAGFGDCEMVFPNEDGTYLRKGTFLRWSWSPLLKAAKIDHRGFHHLRHTAATLMLNAGVPIQVVSRILGHSSPAVTLKIYAHVLPGLEGQARDRMDSLLG